MANTPFVTFPGSFNHEFLSDLSEAIANAVKPLGFTLYDFGGKNYLAPVPGTLNDGQIEPIMFALEKK